jgi:hypothetical protein
MAMMREMMTREFSSNKGTKRPGISDFPNRETQIATSEAATEWMSPRPTFRHCQRQFGPLTTDVCAAGWNTQCARYFAKVDDGVCAAVNGLIQIWEDGNWCNASYNDIEPWVEKAVQSIANGAWTVMLLPAWTGSAWCRNFDLLQYPHEFLPKRPIFVPKTIKTKRHKALPTAPFTDRQKERLKGLPTSPFHVMIVVVGIENQRRFAWSP